MDYEIQHRIETLAHNVGTAGNLAGPFQLMDIDFSHWDFNHRDGWKQHYWLAKGLIEASDLNEAFQKFSAKLAKIVPRVALISQCYVDSLLQPFLIHKLDVDVAFFRFTRDIQGVGLMFMEKEKKALSVLLNNSQIPDEFYYYWNDAVNSFGYPAKLLLMLSAIEALVKIREGNKKGTKDWEKLERILGVELKTALWGTKEDHSNCLRHRLVHGEYFKQDASETNYLEDVHKKVIIYFNDFVLGEKLIEEKIVRPQRHLFGNKMKGQFYIRAKGSSNLILKDILSDIQKTDIDHMTNYEYVYGDARTANY